jgi:hypothetical protein
VSDDSEDEIGAAAYFCWQHKDQAEELAAQASSGPATQLYPLKERNSIDTLVGRLGILDLEEPEEAARRKKRSSREENRTSGSRPPRRINRPATWDNVEGPLMSIPSDVMAERKRRDHRPPKPAPQKKQSFWASLCCGSADDEYSEVVRHKRKTEEEPKPYAQETPMQQVQPPRVQQGHARRHSAQAARPASASRPPSTSRPPLTSRPPTDPPTRKPLGEKTARPINKTTREDSETTILLRYIPKTVSPQLAATILAELSKPISPHDEEGYIYIFWLTPEAAGPAPSSAAFTLLTPPTLSRSDQGRRTSDVMRQYSVKKPQRPGTSRSTSNNAADGDGKDRDTILLKIGRANNVHRRMNEWTRQCGYSLSLVRYYPYVPSSSPLPSSSPPKATPHPSSPTVRKVPHAHRVERLIHLELASQRVIKQCDACGKSHKEWFEVEASKEGVKKVDEVVRRWCEWAERKGDE